MVVGAEGDRAVDVAEGAGQSVSEQLRGRQQRGEPLHQRPEGPGPDPDRSPDRAGKAMGAAVILRGAYAFQKYINVFRPVYVSNS